MLADRHADFRILVDVARGQGWRIEQTASLHWRFVPPDVTKSAYVTAGSPSKKRWIHELRAALRRRGLVL